jgi:hypothetical protein
MPECFHCCDYGFCQVYTGGRVQRVFCDCAAGMGRIESQREALSELGLNPDDPQYKWYRRSDLV